MLFKIHIHRSKADRSIDTDRCHTTRMANPLKGKNFVYTNIDFTLTHRYPRINKNLVSNLVNICYKNSYMK